MSTPSRTRTASRSAERKTDRLEFRVTPSAKEVIQRACAVSGLSAADLAYESARRILAQHEVMELTGANAATFLRALSEPVEAPSRLVDALRRHRELSNGP